MKGLDITQWALIESPRLIRIAVVHGLVAQATYDMLTFSRRFDREKYGLDSSPSHDFRNVSSLPPPNADWAYGIELEKALGLIERALVRYD